MAEPLPAGARALIESGALGHLVTAAWVCALYIAVPVAAAYVVFLRRDVAAE